MTLSRVAGLLAGLVLPVLITGPADAASRHATHHSAPAHVTTAAEQPASVQLVSRHRHHHHRRHVAHRAPRRYG